MVGPVPSAGAHVGVQGVGDGACRPDGGVDACGGKRVADAADVAASQAVGTCDELGGEPLGGQRSWCGAPAPWWSGFLFAVIGGVCACAHAW